MGGLWITVTRNISAVGGPPSEVWGSWRAAGRRACNAYDHQSLALVLHLWRETRFAAGESALRRPFDMPVGCPKRLVRFLRRAASSGTLLLADAARDRFWAKQYADEKNYPTRMHLRADPTLHYTAGLTQNIPRAYRYSCLRAFPFASPNKNKNKKTSPSSFQQARGGCPN